MRNTMCRMDILDEPPLFPRGGPDNKDARTSEAETNRLLLFFGLTAILLLVMARPAFAQRAAESTDQAKPGLCLYIQVLDPSPASIPGASVAIGDRVWQTDQSGVASFCGLGPGPHSMIVTAEGFEVHDGSLEQSEGRVTITLQLYSETVRVVVGSRAQPRSVTESAAPSTRSSSGMSSARDRPPSTIDCAR